MTYPTTTTPKTIEDYLNEFERKFSGESGDIGGTFLDDLGYVSDAKIFLQKALTEHEAQVRRDQIEKDAEICEKSQKKWRFKSGYDRGILGTNTAKRALAKKIRNQLSS